MGIFSDEDISDAQKSVGNSLNKERKIEFLQGFENGWKLIKSGKFYSIADILKWIKDGINTNPEKFGYGFGFLVAILKFRQKEILSYHMDYYVDMIKSLETNPKCAAIIKNRLKRWNKTIKKVSNELTEEQKDYYVTFLRSV